MSKSLHLYKYILSICKHFLSIRFQHNRFMKRVLGTVRNNNIFLKFTTYGFLFFCKPLFDKYKVLYERLLGCEQSINTFRIFKIQLIFLKQALSAEYRLVVVKNVKSSLITWSPSIETKSLVEWRS